MKSAYFDRTLVGVGLAWTLVCCTATAADPPRAVQAWLGPQKWERDLDEPTLRLAEPGAFDDTHLFAPFVVKENDRYLLWYCGSTGNALDVSKERVPDERCFKLGLATSRDGLHFERRPQPVMEILSPDRSILTPSILRSTDGTPICEDGKLRMWFTSSDFSGRTGGHVFKKPQVKMAKHGRAVRHPNAEGLRAVGPENRGRVPNLVHRRDVVPVDHFGTPAASDGKFLEYYTGAGIGHRSAVGDARLGLSVCRQGG